MNIDYEKSSEVANEIVSYLMILFKAKMEKGQSFFEVLVGSIYASKKILKGMELIGMLTSDQAKIIDSVLSSAAEAEITTDENKEMVEFLKSFNDGVDDGKL